MKYILLVLTLNGGSFEWAEFDTKTDAECYKTRLFVWNRKNGETLRKRGFDIPKTWAEYNNKVTVKEK